MNQGTHTNWAERLPAEVPGVRVETTRGWAQPAPRWPDHPYPIEPPAPKAIMPESPAVLPAMARWLIKNKVRWTSSWTVLNAKGLEAVVAFDDIADKPQIDEHNLLVTVSTGTPITELERALLEEGFTTGLLVQDDTQTTVQHLLSGDICIEPDIAGPSFLSRVVGISGHRANGLPFRTVPAPRSATGPSMWRVFVGHSAPRALVHRVVLSIQRRSRWLPDQSLRLRFPNPASAIPLMRQIVQQGYDPLLVTARPAELNRWEVEVAWNGEAPTAEPLLDLLEMQAPAKSRSRIQYLTEDDQLALLRPHAGRPVSWICALPWDRAAVWLERVTDAGFMPVIQKAYHDHVIAAALIGARTPKKFMDAIPTSGNEKERTRPRKLPYFGGRILAPSFPRGPGGSRFDRLFEEVAL